MATFVKWLLTIYVLSILAWSGTLKAEEIVIDHVNFNENQFELSISGQIQNTCGVSIKTQIIDNQFTEEGSVAVVEVSNNEHSKICSRNPKMESFDFLIDVRSLGLKAGHHYQLAFANRMHNNSFPLFSVSIPENSVFPSYQSTLASGMLVQTLKGEWVLVRGENDVVVLKTKLDLSKYLGLWVNVEGTEVLHRTGPVFDLDTLDPLMEPKLVKGPSMFVFSISTATY